MTRFLSLACCLVLLTVLWQCAEGDKKVSEAVRAVPYELEVHRFERAFDQMAPGGLPELKASYPYLFPESVPDSIWIAKQSDTLEVQLRREVAEAFPDFTPYRTELEWLLKHARYHFPEQALPETLITLTSRVDFSNRIVLTDSLLLVALDNYLGPEHEFYVNIDRYIARGLDPEYLVSDVGSALADKLIPPPDARSFISQMVYYGKRLYLKDVLMPLAADSVKIRYSASELDWARANEGQVWRYFIERELLYDTDRELGPRFLDPAPFSKFRLMLDTESPGRMGRFMGWQIVRAYMEGGGHELQEMLRTPGEELFRDAGYKPPKE